MYLKWRCTIIVIIILVEDPITITDFQSYSKVTCLAEVERQRNGSREAFSELRGDKDSNKTTAKNSGSP
jgi:hypothetical protein